MNEHKVSSKRLDGMRYQLACTCKWAWTGVTSSPGSRLALHLEDEGIVPPDIAVLFCAACASYYPAIEATPCPEHEGQHAICLDCAITLDPKSEVSAQS